MNRPNTLWLLRSWVFTFAWNNVSRNGCGTELVSAIGRLSAFLTIRSSLLTFAARGCWKSWRMRSTEEKNHARSRTSGPPNDPPNCIRVNGCSPSPPFSGFEK